MTNDPLNSDAAQKKLRKFLIKTAEQDRNEAKDLLEGIKTLLKDLKDPTEYAKLAQVGIHSVQTMNRCLDNISKFVEICVREELKQTKNIVDDSFSIESIIKDDSKKDT